MRTLILLSPIGTFCADREGRYWFVNKKWCRLTGLRPAEAGGDGWLATIHAEDRRRVSEGWRAAVAAGTEYCCEFRLAQPRGKEKCFRMTVAACRQGGGELKGFLGTLQDVTGRKRAEDALRTRSERFRAFMDNSPAAAFIEDEQGRYEYLNRAGLQALESRGAEAAAGCELFPASQYAVTKFPLPESSQQKLLGGIAIERSPNVDASTGDSWLDRLAESDLIGIVTADRERIIDANDAYLRMVGYTRQELREGKICWPEMTPPEYCETSLKCLDELLTSGVCAPFEKEHIHKDGRRIPILLGATLLEREPLRWVCFILDLRPRKEMEARLQHAHKLESIGFLAAGVAHDFNNLLAVVLGGASIARTRLPVDHAVQETLQMVCDAANRAADLTRQLLAYSGKGRFVVVPVDIPTLIRETVAFLRPQLPSNVEIVVDLPAEVPGFRADPNQMRQVLTNLARNAAEAIGPDDGVVSLALRVESRREDFHQLSAPAPPVLPGDYLVITVRDTGCGMDADTRSRVFDPFFTTKFVGRGLGLSAVDGIVRSYNGSIRISSEPGQGSVFEVYLPFSQAVTGEK